MSTITTTGALAQSHAQWANRPADERFTSITALGSHLAAIRRASAERVVPSRSLTLAPGAGPVRDLTIAGPSGAVCDVSHWAFGQLAALAGAPAGYLRNLPAAMAADCLNYGLQVSRDVEDVGVLLTKTDAGATLRAATGPKYGRVWNVDVARALYRRFGDGTSGAWRVPGAYREVMTAETITRENTTLYASDRDLWVFLVDTEHPIEIADRRDGKPGTLTRGLIFWNSEVGAGTLGMASFVFDFMCGNHYIWGASQIEEVRVRHTASAPTRFVEDVAPAMQRFAESSATGITAAIEDARAHRIADVSAFLAQRFGPRVAPRIEAAHLADEGRPIESRWDVLVGATAYSRSMANVDARMAFDRDAGKLLEA